MGVNRNRKNLIVQQDGREQESQTRILQQVGATFEPLVASQKARPISARSPRPQKSRKNFTELARESARADDGEQIYVYRLFMLAD